MRTQTLNVVVAVLALAVLCALAISARSFSTTLGCALSSISGDASPECRSELTR